jgi:hypothetical protein
MSLAATLSDGRRGVTRDRASAERIRRAIELVEQAPAEALYQKLLHVLTEAGTEAEMHGEALVSRRLAFAYKLAVELGGKVALLDGDDLTGRRRLAALLFGECDEPGPHPGGAWTPGDWS